MIRHLLPLCVLLGALAVATADDEQPDGHVRDPGPLAGFAHLSHDRDVQAKQLLEFESWGRTFAKTRPIRWGRVEPMPPRSGKPAYDWKSVDAAIRVWQLAGLEPVPVLSPKSPWGCVPLDKTAWVRRVTKELSAAEAEAAMRTQLGAPTPRPEHWVKWERFVHDFVERYDGDGEDDMPGLRRPVRYLQILDRADLPSGWLGSADEYLRLLHHAGQGAKNAFETVRIVHGAVDLRAIGHHPHPRQAGLAHRIETSLPAAPQAARLETQRALDLIFRSLEMPRLFSVLPQVGSNSHADDAANVRFLRTYLDEHGASHIGVWLVDNPTYTIDRARDPTARKLAAAEERIRTYWSKRVRWPKQEDRLSAVFWTRRGQAFDVVRSAARACAAGADVVLFRGPSDGLRRSEHSYIDEQNELATFLTAEGQPKPAWYAWRQMNRLLRDHSTVSEEAIGAPGVSVVFQLPAEPLRPWTAVLMLDDTLSWGGEPGKPLPSREVAVPVPNGTYWLEEVQLGPGKPKRTKVKITSGVLTTNLTPAPLYVIPTY